MLLFVPFYRMATIIAFIHTEKRIKGVKCFKAFICLHFLTLLNTFEIDVKFH